VPKAPRRCQQPTSQVQSRRHVNRRETAYDGCGWVPCTRAVAIALAEVWEIAEGVEKGLCRLQIGGIEPLGIVVIDGLQNRLRVGGKVVIAQQRGKLVAARTSEDRAPCLAPKSDHLGGSAWKIRRDNLRLW
jgi:hypothetical protein